MMKNHDKPQNKLKLEKLNKAEFDELCEVLTNSMLEEGIIL